MAQIRTVYKTVGTTQWEKNHVVTCSRPSGFPCGSVTQRLLFFCLLVCLSFFHLLLSVCLSVCLSRTRTRTHTRITPHTTGSMDLENFSKFANYFVSNLPEGYGAGGKCVILILDGHSSRWDPVALHLFKANNVHVWVIASHTSAWGQVYLLACCCCCCFFSHPLLLLVLQVGDNGPIYSFKAIYDRLARQWRYQNHGFKMLRHHFNELFVQVCLFVVGGEGDNNVFTVAMCCRRGTFLLSDSKGILMTGNQTV